MPDRHRDRRDRHLTQPRTQFHLHSNKHTQQPQSQPQRPTTPPSPDILMLDGSEATYLLDLQISERDSSNTSSNEDFSRLGSESLSYVDVNTIRSSSVAETKDTESYVLVQGVRIGQRQPSLEDEMMEEAASDGKSYSTPSEGEEREWMPAAVDNEMVMDDRQRSRADVLHGLSTPYPQQVYNGYEASTVSTSEEDIEYQESTDYYTLHTSPRPGSYSMVPDQSVPRTFDVPSRPYPQDSSDSPWNPVGANRTRYDHGFAAFMPSPGPVGKQTVEEILQGSPKTRQVTKVNQKNGRSRSRSHSHSHASKSSSKGKERATESGWEHTVVKKDGLGKLVSIEEKKRRGPARRKGKLDPETRKKARKMRQIKSCWRCWNLKITCSEGEHCTPCLKRYSSVSPASDQLCCRAGFDEYEPAFFPDFLNAHLKKSQVVDFISKHSNGFGDVALEVEVTTGQLFKPMRLQTNTLRAKDFNLLVHQHLAVNVEDSGSQLVCRSSAPLGLMGMDMSDLTEICRHHIEDMVENPDYPLQATAGDPTHVPQSILEIVQQYYISKKSALVRKAMMLHAINYSMSRLVTFTAESALRIAETLSLLDPYMASDEPFISSRLLNRQIKYVLHKLHREITKEVLEGLEKSMRAKSRDSWGPSLCAILILSLCIENLQIAAETFVVCDMENLTSQYSRKDSSGACVVLEEYPYERCTRLFHDIYRSHKQSSGKAKDGAFNPIQLEYKVDASAGWDKTTSKMAIAVRELIHNSYDELACLSERSQFVNLRNANLIKINNTGRLSSKFLLSFCGTAT